MCLVMFFGKRIRSLSYDSSNRIPTTSSMPNAKEKKRPRGCSSSVTDDGSKILADVGGSSPSHLAYLRS